MTDQHPDPDDDGLVAGIVNDAKAALEKLANTKMELSLSDWGECALSLMRAIDIVAQSQRAAPDREGIDRSAAIEALCQARCTIPNVHWADGLTEGVARIERMLAEKQLGAILSLVTTAGRVGIEFERLHRRLDPDMIRKLGEG